MPSLETGSNLLTAPPGGNERAGPIKAPEPAMAQQSASGSAETEASVLLGAASQNSLPSEKILEPMPADGVMRGEFSGSSVAFADPEGLVCAGRLIGHSSELNLGASVPVNCSDGSAGKVMITFLTPPDEAGGTLLLGDSRSSPVRLVRSANMN